ncbi:uncharacterized protein LOC125660755 [Ostrea edulis]|uniref:uncharacterized protein LOC125660755 n=1 Tax=Ostrea edulis TaxID=37623 RepID=UPI0024AF4A2F|nr:uncharacterized protein LOC125660755 [Ostrea edulis]
MVTMAAFIVGFLLCVYFDASVGHTEIEAIQRLEEMVTDLKERSVIQDQKIAAIQTENDKLKKRMGEISNENIGIKQDIWDLWKQNKRQMQINNELNIKINEMNNTMRRTRFQQTDNGKTGYNISRLNTSHKSGSYFTKTFIHTGLWDDTQTSNLTTSKKHQLSGKESTGLSFRSRRSRRLLLPENQPSAPSIVAFFAYMSKVEDHPGRHHTLIYDVAHTNIGGHYSPHTGSFTVPTHGVYVFTWNIYSRGGSSAYAYTDIVVNSNAVSGSFAGSNTNSNAITSPATVVLELNQGDDVHIRTAADQPISGSIYSYPSFQSTFSGWKLF